MTDHNLEFIQMKLQQVPSAIMYIMSNSTIRLPNDIITFQKIDEEGHLWFRAHKPKPGTRVFEKSFPVHLVFYRKGTDFYIESSGTAQVAGKEENEGDKEEGRGSILIRMKPSFIEYTETRKKQQILPGIARFYTNISQWVVRQLLPDNSRKRRIELPRSAA
jgi:hypothetical protein